MKISSRYRVSITVRLDEPVRLESTTYPRYEPAACYVVRASTDDGKDWAINADGYAYRKDGSVGKSSRQLRFLDMSVLPAEVRQAIEDEYQTVIESLCDV